MSSLDWQPQQVPDFLEASIQLTMYSDPTHSSLVKKAIMQKLVQENVEYSPIFGGRRPVNLGIFRVLPVDVDADWQSPSGDLEVAAGDTYLDFHLPKSDNITNTVANAGYSRIAYFMKKDPTISKILGVTYPLMAVSARRNQGFHTEELDLPPAVMNFATAYWQKMMQDAKAKHFQSAYVVWQDRDEFLDRFATSV